MTDTKHTPTIDEMIITIGQASGALWRDKGSKELSEEFSRRLSVELGSVSKFLASPRVNAHDDLVNALRALRNHPTVEGLTANIRNYAHKNGNPDPIELADAALTKAKGGQNHEKP